jgi:hypothetical protein
MCKIGCIKLEDFIRYNVHYESVKYDNPKIWNYEVIADQVRAGIVALFEGKQGELKWKFNPTVAVETLEVRSHLARLAIRVSNV